MIYGNIDGVRNSLLEGLEDIYDIKIDKNTFINEEVLDKMLKTTVALEREVSVAVDRRGRVVSVAIGDSTSVEVPMLDIRERKLSGVRVIHTHPNGTSRLSALDNSALIRMKLDAIIALGVQEDIIKEVTMGFCFVQDNVLQVESYGPMTLDKALTLT